MGSENVGGYDRGTLADSGASALTNWTFATGLNGDMDGDYEGEYEITIAAGGGPNLSLSFNANSDPANTVGLGIQMSNAGAVAGVGVTSCFIGRDPVGGGGTLTGWFRLASKSGRVRGFTCSSAYKDAGGNSYKFNHNAYIPSATNTVIADLRILSTVASGIAAHATVRWWRTRRLA